MTMIEIRHISFAYSDNLEPILKDISLTFKSGQRIAIVGQNGTGKTTLIKQLNGLLKPTSGDVLIDGVSVNSRPTFEWAKKIGYVFQNPNDQLFLDSVKKEFLFGITHLKNDDSDFKKRLTETAALTGLTDCLTRHPHDLTDVQKKFCTIGSVLMTNPEIVILDEPTGGQDYSGKKRLGKLLLQLHQQNKICIAVSHDMKFISKNFDRVIVMKEGTVLLDASPTEVFSNSKELAKAMIVPPPIPYLSQRLGWQTKLLHQNEFITYFQQHMS